MSGHPPVSLVEETTLTPAVNWWQSAVIYEVYPRSFADGDGDGVGDLAGLMVRLPSIAALGVDGIWMTPFQPSPQLDQGYDVTDYCGVDPLFGTMEQFDELLELAHSLGLRVLLDVVPNFVTGRALESNGGGTTDCSPAYSCSPKIRTEFSVQLPGSSSRAGAGFCVVRAASVPDVVKPAYP